MDECFEGRICSRGGGTVVQGGTGRPCYASTWENAEKWGGTVVLVGTGAPCCVSTWRFLENEYGTVVRYGTGAPCELAGRGNWIFTVLGVFVFFFLMYLGVMWVTLKPWLWYQLMYMRGGSEPNQTQINPNKNWTKVKRKWKIDWDGMKTITKRKQRINKTLHLR